MQDYLTERGEPMTHQDLIRPDGVGDQITMALAAREQLRPFFSAKYWQDKPRLELQETWNKLHEESREGLGSIYILLHKLEQMQQSHEMGR